MREEAKHCCAMAQSDYLQRLPKLQVLATQKKTKHHIQQVLLRTTQKQHLAKIQQEHHAQETNRLLHHQERQHQRNVQEIQIEQEQQQISVNKTKMNPTQKGTSKHKRKVKQHKSTGASGGNIKHCKKIDSLEKRGNI